MIILLAQGKAPGWGNHLFGNARHLYALLGFRLEKLREKFLSKVLGSKLHCFPPLFTALGSEHF